MSDIDSIVQNLRVSADALATAKALAESANAPQDEIIALEQAAATVKATLDRMYWTEVAATMTDGLAEDMTISGPRKLKGTE
jgi:hypothetical protein